MENEYHSVLILHTSMILSDMESMYRPTDNLTKNRRPIADDCGHNDV